MNNHKKNQDILGAAAAAAAKSLQSCPTLCDPIDGSPPGSPIPGILQAILECVAISFSNARKWKVKVKSLSHVRLCAIPRIAAYQAPPVHGIFQARVLEWGAIAFSDFRGMYIIKGKQISIIFFQSVENIKTILAPEGHIRTSSRPHLAYRPCKPTPGFCPQLLHQRSICLFHIHIN